PCSLRPHISSPHPPTRSFSFTRYRPPLLLPSFPTRRSSDLARLELVHAPGEGARFALVAGRAVAALQLVELVEQVNELQRCDCTDRKSTRLNSSHLGISYAVFCLKKKKKRECRQKRLVGDGV